MRATEDPGPQPDAPDDDQTEIDAEDEALAVLFQERKRQSAHEAPECWLEAND